MWKGNKQVICGPYGSGKTVLIQCKAATLACCGQHVLVIVPHHLVKSYSDILKEIIKPEENYDKFITLISIRKFYTSFYKYEKLAENRHVLVDELLYPTTRDMYDHIFLDFLSRLLKESKRCVWIAPHAYLVTKHMFFNKNFESALCLPFQFKRKLSEYFVFLRITMRTTKEIHDYKNRLEFIDFKHEFKSEDKDKAANDDFFQLLYINNVLGHSISGFPVQTISYLNHYHYLRQIICILYQNIYNGDKIYQYELKFEKEPFHHFAATKIIEKVKGLKDIAPDIEYQDIAIIMDYYEKLHSLISELSPVNDPLEKLKGYLQILNFEGGNAVTMCYSNEIASLEWPVVFHIQSTDLRNANSKDNDKISFIQSEHDLIISRCTAYFIHICFSHPDSFTNKSFGEKFNAWYHKQHNHKKRLDEAIKEYCE